MSEKTPDLQVEETEYNSIPELMELNDKQRLFVLEYVVTRDAKNSAINAGYTKNSSYNQGYELRHNPKIKAAIDAILEIHFKKLGITKEKILQRLDNIGGIDIGDAYDDQSCLLPIKQMPRHVRKAIESIKVFEKWERVPDPESGAEKIVKTGEVVSVKFCDKVKSNELLGRNTKAWDEPTVVVNNYINMSDEAMDARIEALLEKRNG